MAKEKPLAVGFVRDRWEAGVVSLSHEAEYVYFRLCADMWTNGEGVELEEVPRVCRHFPGWEKCLQELVKKGKVELLDGRYVNARAIAEHSHAITSRDKARTRAQKAASARYGCSSTAQADAQALHKDSLCSSTPTQTLGPEDSPPSSPPLEAEGSPTLADEVAQPKTGHEPDKPAGKARASPRGHRLPEDWQPSEQDREFARGHGFSEREIDDAAGEFRDHWRDQPGQRGVKVSWSGTWNNRIRVLAGRRQRPLGFHADSRGRGPAGSVVAAARELLAETAGEAEHRPDADFRQGDGGDEF